MTSSNIPRATPNEFFLINVVHVSEPKLQDLALEVLRSAVGHVAENYSAFQWSRLYKSLDGLTVINQAKWTDRASFDAIFEDQEFLSRYSRLKETGTWEFHLYEMTDHITPANVPLPSALETAD